MRRSRRGDEHHEEPGDGSPSRLTLLPHVGCDARRRPPTRLDDTTPYISPRASSKPAIVRPLSDPVRLQLPIYLPHRTQFAVARCAHPLTYSPPSINPAVQPTQSRCSPTSSPHPSSRSPPPPSRPRPRSSPSRRRRTSSSARTSPGPPPASSGRSAPTRPSPGTPRPSPPRARTRPASFSSATRRTTARTWTSRTLSRSVSPSRRAR